MASTRPPETADRERWRPGFVSELRRGRRGDPTNRKYRLSRNWGPWKTRGSTAGRPRNTCAPADIQARLWYATPQPPAFQASPPGHGPDQNAAMKVLRP